MNNPFRGCDMCKTQCRPLLQANRAQRRFRGIPGTVKATVFEGELRRRGAVAGIPSGGALFNLIQAVALFDDLLEPDRYQDIGFAALFDMDEPQWPEFPRAAEAA